MERYEIIIKGEKYAKKKTNVSGEDEKDKNTNVAGEDEEDDKKDKASGITAKMIVKTAVNEARALIVPRIGEIQRDSLLQMKIDDTMNIVDTATSFAINPAYGALNLATKMASKLITYTIQAEKEQNRLNVAMRRASYINRSRE